MAKGYPQNHGRAPLISRHMNDLLKKPVSVVMECLEDPNTPGDYRQRKASKSLAARAVAARYVLKAIQGSASHGDTLLDRVEGKVTGNEGEGGQQIVFNFNTVNYLGGGPPVPGSAGEAIQGVLASQAINPLPLHTRQLQGAQDQVLKPGSPDDACIAEGAD